MQLNFGIFAAQYRKMSPMILIEARADRCRCSEP